MCGNEGKEKIGEVRDSVCYPVEKNEGKEKIEVVKDGVHDPVNTMEKSEP